jgi:uncharacterized lipoprotein YddW (UPF0748 family)
MRKLSIRCRFGSLFLAVWLVVELVIALPALGSESAQTHPPYRTHLPVVTNQQREARALWISRFDWGSPPSQRSRLEYLINRAADSGFNIILFQVRATGDAFYRSGLEPWSYRLTSASPATLGTDPGWDPLGVAIATAHSRGLQLHAYVNLYSTWECGRGQPPHTTPEHPYWALASYQASPPYYDPSWRVYANTPDGPAPMSESSSGPSPCSEYLWSSPGVDRVNEHNLAVIRDIVARYPVDGVHLDRARYPGRQYSVDPETMAKLGAATPPVSLADWQRDNLSHWMTRFYTEAKRINPTVTMSAAVWFTYKKTPAITFPTTQGYSDYYQDSHRWLREGALDAMAPMIYGATFNSDFTKWQVLADDHVAVQQNRQVWLGIGSAITPFEGIEQRIIYARRIGAAGIAIWSAGAVEANGYWDDFRAGPFRVDAVPP